MITLTVPGSRTLSALLRGTAVRLKELVASLSSGMPIGVQFTLPFREQGGKERSTDTGVKLSNPV